MSYQKVLLALYYLIIWKIISYINHVIFHYYSIMLYYINITLPQHAYKDVYKPFLFLHMGYILLLLFFLYILIQYHHIFIFLSMVDFNSPIHLSIVLVLIQLNHNWYKIYMYVDLHFYYHFLLYNLLSQNQILMFIFFIVFLVLHFLQFL